MQEVNDKHWYVMRTLGRFCEAGVKQKLEECNIRYYQAMKSVVKIVRGKSNVVEEPVIPNLLFVYGEKDEIIPLTAMGSNFQFVYNRCSGKPSDCLIVPTKAMNDFIRVTQSEGMNTHIFMPEEVALTKGQKIRIIGGALNGVEGDFVKMKGSRCKKLVVVIDGLFGVSAEVEPDMIEILN